MELEGIFARLENRLRARNRRAVKELSVDPNDLRAFVETILPECNERHRNGVLSSAVGALTSPASYLARRRKQLARRGITEPVPNLYVIALVDVLVKLGFAAEIDGNAGYETLFEEVSGLASGRGVNLRGITGASSLGIAEILREFGSDLVAQGYVLAALDVDSDSYVLLVMPEAAYDRSSALAERVAIRMTRF